MKQHLSELGIAFALLLTPTLIVFAQQPNEKEPNPIPPSPAPPAHALSGPPLAIQIVTDQDDETEITLSPETRLIVRLRTNPATGYQWHLLMPADSPLTLVKPPLYTPASPPVGVLGATGVAEWEFSAKYLPGVTQAF